MSTAPTASLLFALRAALAILGLTFLAPSIPAQVVVEGHVFVRTHDLRLFPVQGVSVRAQRSTGWGTLEIHSPNVTTDASGRYSLTLNAGSGPGDYDLYAAFPGATNGALSIEYSNNMFLTGPVGTEAELLAPKATLNSGLNSGYDIYWPQPIAFLHGMASNRSSWTCVSNYFRNTWAQTGGTGCLPSPRRIPRRGYITARLEYDWASILPLPSALAEIQELRNMLARFGLGHVPIDLVAHSYGGLMARAMLTDPVSTARSTASTRLAHRTADRS